MCYSCGQDRRRRDTFQRIVNVLGISLLGPHESDECREKLATVSSRTPLTPRPHLVHITSR